MTEGGKVLLSRDTEVLHCTLRKTFYRAKCSLLQLYMYMCLFHFTLHIHVCVVVNEYLYVPKTHVKNRIHKTQDEHQISTSPQHHVDLYLNISSFYIVLDFISLGNEVRTDDQMPWITCSARTINPNTRGGVVCDSIKHFTCRCVLS